MDSEKRSNEGACNGDDECREKRTARPRDPRLGLDAVDRLFQEMFGDDTRDDGCGESCSCGDSGS